MLPLKSSDTGGPLRSTKYIIVKRSEVVVGPEKSVVKLTCMRFFVFDIMNKDQIFNETCHKRFDQD